MLGFRSHSLTSPQAITCSRFVTKTMARSRDALAGEPIADTRCSWIWSFRVLLSLCQLATESIHR